MTARNDTAQPEPKKSKPFAALCSIRRSLRVSMTQAADILVPPQCGFCEIDLQRPQTVATQQESKDSPNNPPSSDEILLCTDCRESFVDSDWIWCKRCGTSRPPKETSRDRCWKCRKTPPRFDAVVPLGQYRDELRQAVLRMKQGHYDHLSATMGHLHATHRFRPILDFQPDIAVPVPMHWTRQIDRGTNSAQILAVEIARKLGISTVVKLLTRCRNTIPQTELPPENRASNVSVAFRPTTGYDIHGARVLLVDDILTTGATCNEIASVLKQAGARCVIVAVIARAEGLARQ